MSSRHDRVSSCPASATPESLTYRKSVFTHSYTDGTAYTNFALMASDNVTAFATFRQTYYHRKFAGIENDGRLAWNSAFHAHHMEEALGVVGSEALLARALPIIRELDLIGGGYTFPLVGHGQVRVSGLLMRYLGKVADLEQLFGSLDGLHLIEIGVGFGGFAALLLRLHPRIASYTLVDLPEVLHLVGRYIRAARVAPEVLYLNAAPCRESRQTAFAFETRPAGYDLAISMYAFGEVPPDVRRAYVENILSRSTRGWVSDMSSVRCCYHMFLPAILRSSPGARNVTDREVLVVQDLMSGHSHSLSTQAQVGWGVAHDYFEPLVTKMRATSNKKWLYPFKKLTRAEAFVTSNRFADAALRRAGLSLRKGRPT